MIVLKRKIDNYLRERKLNKEHVPLIVKGARQVGKTFSIREFAKKNYSSFIEINFISDFQYRDIFDDGFDIDTIIKRISFKDNNVNFIHHQTLIFFDEIQVCPNAATSLKFFKEDGRFDVICSGSLMGINYKEIESNSVGYKEDYEMQSLDFEEFLWALNYSDVQIQDLYSHMLALKPFSKFEYDILLNHFKDYMIVGGMPFPVATFIQNKNFVNILNLKRNILTSYKEDAVKYSSGLDRGKILAFYNNIPVFLSKENKKFQISKINKNARNRDYIGVIEWLENAGIINVCYQLEALNIPLKANYLPNSYKVYFKDTGLLVASLDDEADYDLRLNNNFGIYKGALFENAVAEMLSKEGLNLYFYKNEKSTIEMDFIIRDRENVVPVEVKAEDGSILSLNKLINDKKYNQIKYGIKLANKNIGFNGHIFTFPYFLGFLLKRFLNEFEFDKYNGEKQ